MSLLCAFEELLRRLLRGATGLSASLLFLLAIAAGLEPQPSAAGHAAPHFAPAAFAQAVVRAGDASPLAGVQRAQHRAAQSFDDEPLALPPQGPQVWRSGIDLHVTATALESLHAASARAFNARAPPAGAVHTA